LVGVAVACLPIASTVDRPHFEGIFVPLVKPVKVWVVFNPTSDQLVPLSFDT
jgi:hypothetical protein